MPIVRGSKPRHGDDVFTLQQIPRGLRSPSARAGIPIDNLSQVPELSSGGQQILRLLRRALTHPSAAAPDARREARPSVPTPCRGDAGPETKNTSASCSRPLGCRRVQGGCSSASSYSAGDRGLHPHQRPQYRGQLFRGETGWIDGENNGDQQRDFHRSRKL